MAVPRPGPSVAVGGGDACCQGYWDRAHEAFKGHTTFIYPSYFYLKCCFYLQAADSLKDSAREGSFKPPPVSFFWHNL